MSGNPFSQQIQKNIVKVLSPSNVKFFRVQLKNELNQIGIKLGIEPLTRDNPDDIAKVLIVVLKKGKQKIPVINKVLKPAMRKCFDKQKYKETYDRAKPHHTAINEAVDSLLGWLVLASIDESVISQTASWDEFLPSLYYEFPVSTDGGVELLSSWYQKRKATLKLDGNNLSGEHIIRVDDSPFTWNDDDNLNKLKLLLWNAVYDDSRTDSLSDDESAYLNADLSTFREDDDDMRHYAFAITFEDNGRDDYKDCYKDLLKEFDELPLIRFGIKAEQSIFCTLEYHLMSAIRNFISNKKILTST